MAQFSRRLAFGLVSSLVTVWGLGCGDEAPPKETDSTEKATVTGTVTVDGKKLNRGEVSFDPASTARKSAPVATTKIEGGKYKLETLVGPNAVRVNSPDMKRGGGAGYDVKSGSNEYNIDLHLTR